MVGWLIVISTQTPEERDAGVGRSEAVLANWETSVGGNAWLRALVEAGKAVQLVRGGYPDRYTASAADVLPLIDAGRPPSGASAAEDEDGSIARTRVREVIFHPDRIAACPADRVLTIEVWDLS